MPIIVDNNILSISQMIVLTKKFVPYAQFYLDIILKVTAANFNLNLADLNCCTNLPQESNQAVFSIVCRCRVTVTQSGLSVVPVN